MAAKKILATFQWPELKPWMQSRQKGVSLQILPSDCCFSPLAATHFLIKLVIRIWLPIKAGVPQGTKLSPILFLVMFNNLIISTPKICIWKYINKVTLSEGLERKSNSNIQSSVDTIISWSFSNCMNSMLTIFDTTLTKAHKRLHILCVLTRAAVEDKDLVKIPIYLSKNLHLNIVV